MTIRSVTDASTPHSGSPVRLDVSTASAPEAAFPTYPASTASTIQEDTLQGTSGADMAQTDTARYDSAWSSTAIPSKEPDGFEEFMVGGGKIYVVLAVVLIIWIGLLAFLFSTDRRIRSLERDLD